MYQCEAWYVRHGVCQMSQMEIHCCDWIGFDMTDIVCVRWTCTTMPLVQRVSNWTSCTGRHNGLIRDSRTGDPPSLTDWLLRTVAPSRPSHLSHVTHSVTVLNSLRYWHSVGAVISDTVCNLSQADNHPFISPHNSNISDGLTPSAHIWAFSSPTHHAATRCCECCSFRRWRRGHMTIVISYVVVWLDDDHISWVCWVELSWLLLHVMKL